MFEFLKKFYKPKEEIIQKTPITQVINEEAKIKSAILDFSNFSDNAVPSKTQKGSCGFDICGLYCGICQ